jgi:hypothetical protein
MHRRWAAILVVGAVLVSARPASSALTFASVEILRPILSQMLGNPPLMRMDVVPDIYEGGYARVSVYAQQAAVGGMRVDEMWIRLVGVSFAPAELNRGVLRVLGVRDSGVYGKLNLQNVEAFLARQGTIQDVQLTRDGDSVIASGTVLYNGVPTHARIRGVFQVYGEPEIYFHIEALFVNSLPVPYVVVDRLERSMNPVVDFRSWPVPFKIRSFRSTPEGFVLSSQRDVSQPCTTCGGPELRLTR